jgi:predicted  nucleic acid-binding Zn-ribbon protein
MKDHRQQTRSATPERPRIDPFDARLAQLEADIMRIQTNQHKIEEKITSVEYRIDRLVTEMIELKRKQP